MKIPTILKACNSPLNLNFKENHFEDVDRALQALTFLKSLESSFLNREMASRVMLTVTIMTAEGKRSFSKLEND
jgi:hypothetical protein